MRRVILILQAVLLVTLIGCSKLKEKGTQVQPANIYAGSQTCNACHADKYGTFIGTGHPYILNKVNNAAPSYPHGPGVPNPPSGHSWSDISYVIGGFGWAANFVDNTGNLIIGDAAKYALADSQFHPFNLPQDQVGYGQNCAPCHTTGYSADGHQNDLPNITGTWAFDGVQCERCHGPGYQHTRAPQDSTMTVDASSQACGQCHNRTSDSRILATGGPDSTFILNYQQYDEVRSTLHANLACATCHDPHRSAKYDTENALVRKCPDCHVTITVNHPDVATCVDCHMPYSDESGTSFGAGIHRRADLRSHIVKINPDTTAAQFFTADGQTYSRGYNNLNFSCLSICHQSFTLAFAAANAPTIHGTP